MRRRVSPVSSGICLQRCVAGALGALLVLSGSSWPESVPDAKPLTAILLVAREDLPDSNFADSVVLVMNNLGPAPVGIIINRPMPISVSQLLADLEHRAQVRDKVYFGGPVSFGSVWFLFRARTPPEHAIQACDGVYRARTVSCCSSCSAATSRWTVCGSSSATPAGLRVSLRPRSHTATGLSGTPTRRRSSTAGPSTPGPRRRPQSPAHDDPPC
jgi:hypothetical protein